MGVEGMELREVREDRGLVSEIDWEMTPEEAVTRYLEWGNNWSHGKHFVRSKRDFSCYFVVDTWEDPPEVRLIRRNSDEAKELARIPLPEQLREPFLDQVGRRKGVYALTEEIRAWLEDSLSAN
jgi:hypothetical protein